MSDNELITVLQAVELTGQAKGVIWHAIRDGRLPIARKFRPILLHVADVLEWAKPAPPLISEDDLRRLYIDERKSISQIAKEYGKAPMVVQRLMVKHGIPRRSVSEANTGRDTRAGMSEEAITRWKANISNSHRGKKLNISEQDRQRRSKFLTEVSKRPRGEEYRRKQRESHAGEKCWRWKGGSDHYRGPNWQQQRREARKRDNYTCQRCGITEAVLGQDLDAHHIVPFSQFSDYREANRLSNLACYCKTCHAIVEHATNG
jgi:5-methylcytosine-specific restriction endonuclease McrA